MENSEPCDLCGNTGLVIFWHREFKGVYPLIVERVDKMGEVHKERVKETISAFCSCRLGLWMLDRQEKRDGRRPLTVADVLANRVPYVLPPEPEEFKSYADAMAWMRRFRERPGKAITDTFPKVPAASRKLTAIDIANQLRERAEREDKEPAV